MIKTAITICLFTTISNLDLCCSISSHMYLQGALPSFKKQKLTPALIQISHC